MKTKIEEAAIEMVRAQRRMRDQWAEAAQDAPLRRELWSNLHLAGDYLFEELETSRLKRVNRPCAALPCDCERDHDALRRHLPNRPKKSKESKR